LLLALSPVTAEEVGSVSMQLEETWLNAVAAALADWRKITIDCSVVGFFLSPSEKPPPWFESLLFALKRGAALEAQSLAGRLRRSGGEELRWPELLAAVAALPSATVRRAELVRAAVRGESAPLLEALFPLSDGERRVVHREMRRDLVCLDDPRWVQALEAAQPDWRGVKVAAPTTASGRTAEASALKRGAVVEVVDEFLADGLWGDDYWSGWW
jgi:hypothetical protein